MKLQFIVLSGCVLMGSVNPSIAQQPQVVGEQVLDEWDIQGSSKYHYNLYQTYGNKAINPYPSQGADNYVDLNTSYSRKVSAYEHYKGSISAVVNYSDYRAVKRDLIVERANMIWEKGDGFVPYRLHGGDFLAYQSLRTVHRGLKGVQVEFHPDVGEAIGDHSIQLFSGVVDNDYRDLDKDKDVYSGFSWLVEKADQGALSVNWTRNYRESNDTFSRPARVQQVMSIAGEMPFKSNMQDVIIEAELGRFMGDHNSGSSRGERTDQEGNAIFLSASSRFHNVPLSYHIQFEEYDHDYRPRGANILSDHRAVTSSASWRFDSGVIAKARLEHYRDDLETLNPTDTHLKGLNVSGPILGQFIDGLNVGVSGFISDVADKNHTVDTKTSSLSVNAKAPVNKSVSVQAAALGNIVKSIDGSNDITRQVSMGFFYQFHDDDSSLNGSISPNFVARYLTADGSRSTSLNPNIALSLQKDKHHLKLSYNFLSQDPSSITSVDVDTIRASAAYSYHYKNHRFAADISAYDRSPDQYDDTHAYKFGASWSYHFNKPASAQIIKASKVTVPKSYKQHLPQMLELAPGVLLADIQKRLAASNIKNPTVQGGYLVYETSLFDHIAHRQRLVLQTQKERVIPYLERSALIIEADNIGSTHQTFERLYHKVRDLLIKQYGRPSQRIEKGDFMPDLTDQLQLGNFVRILDWNTPEGVMRFGIPNRADGILRLELAHARSFNDDQMTDWSIFEIK